jgi:Ca-activated chloride channel homolog
MRHHSRGVLFVLVVGLGAVAAGLGTLTLAAQQPTFKSRASIVSLFATVTDAQKRLVPGLVKGDFSIFDNDKPQPLVVFDNTVQPISVVVLLDTSGSMTENLARLREACEQFLIRLLPADQGKVGAFNDRIQISSKFTSNRDQLITEVRNLDYGNGTRLFDALLLGLDELKNIEGRRVILVFTDGDDTTSKTHFGTVLDRARGDETMVYGIGFESVYFDGVRMVKSKPDGGLQKLAEDTGGGYFELSKTDDLGPTFSRVALELHSQYVLGFEAKQLDGKVHKLTLKMTQPGMNARARRTYVADAANIR